MKLKNLDVLPQEYFLHKFGPGFPGGHASNVWRLFILNFVFLLFSIAGIGKDYPSYIHFSFYAILFFNIFYIVPCIVFSSQKRIDRHIQGYISAMMIGSWIFQLEFWFSVTVLGMGLLCNGGGYPEDQAKGMIVFAAALAVLLSGVITQILMLRRMVRRISEGHFRKGGKGFWGDWKHKNTVVAILAVISPILMSFGSASVFISKFWRIKWDVAYAPFAMIVAPLLAYAMLFLFDYLNTYGFIRKYYIKRFGTPENTTVQEGFIDEN